uniref:Uncharacterized protein n=1 Tax=Chromera velia CCMP2878 TaxID=1169474 RepID=A0A0G4F945_9ALVE|eukprot:Cvel_15810.t1-p1 / transcript=Cvel_15810.t1 / gene=Cvel_15810 / organism=Chromera_velia_CCMP2878 / gene_product=hypothetical protein / transcript_product=hypothetical protein / location=Cvel_scaffold1187:40252-41069(+) / protein_length=191 / sequence_SO=supercontig / SO=protein_coding / is_pseudo=false
MGTRGALNSFNGPSGALSHAVFNPTQFGRHAMSTTAGGANNVFHQSVYAALLKQVGPEEADRMFKILQPDASLEMAKGEVPIPDSPIETLLKENIPEDVLEEANKGILRGPYKQAAQEGLLKEPYKTAAARGVMPFWWHRQQWEQRTKRELIKNFLLDGTDIDSDLAQTALRNATSDSAWQEYKLERYGPG